MRKNLESLNTMEPVFHSKRGGVNLAGATWTRGNHVRGVGGVSAKSREDGDKSRKSRWAPIIPTPTLAVNLTISLFVPGNVSQDGRIHTEQ